MLKKIITIVGLFIAIILIFMFANYLRKLFILNPFQQLRSVEYIGGNHGDAWREDEYIVYRESVTIKNNTNRDIQGYIIADVSREFMHIEESELYAYSSETGEKMLFYIPAQETVEFRNLLFKGTSLFDEGTIRTNRYPLYDVYFEEIEIEN